MKGRRGEERRVSEGVERGVEGSEGIGRSGGGAKRKGGVEGEQRGREEWRGSKEEGRSGGGAKRKGGVEGEQRGREEWRGSKEEGRSGGEWREREE